MGLPEDIAAVLGPPLKDQIALHHADIIAHAGNFLERQMAERYFPGIMRAVPDMLAATVASQEPTLRQITLWDLMVFCLSQRKVVMSANVMGAAPQIQAAFEAHPQLATMAIDWHSWLTLAEKYGPQVLDDIALILPAPWSTALHTIAQIIRGLNPAPAA